MRSKICTLTTFAPTPIPVWERSCRFSARFPDLICTEFSWCLHISGGPQSPFPGNDPYEFKYSTGKNFQTKTDSPYNAIMSERTLWASLSGAAEFIDLSPDSILRRAVEFPGDPDDIH